MFTSNPGKLELLLNEGVVLGPYRDSVGVWTYGVGHTAAAGGLDPATMPRGVPTDLEAELRRAMSVFSQDLVAYEKRVTSAIRVPLAQHQFDALVDFDFNTGGIFRARLTQRINARDPKASDSFFGWLQPPALRGRRVREQRLFDHADYANDDVGVRIPVYLPTSTGGLKLWKTLDNDELNRYLPGVASKSTAAPVAAGLVSTVPPPSWVTVLVNLFGTKP